MKVKMLLIGTLTAWLGIATAASFTVRIQRHGTNVTTSPAEDFATNVLRLFRTCSVDSTSYGARPNPWEKLLASESFVDLKLAEPVAFRVTGLSRMDELLVPLPSGKFPSHLFARSGTNVFAVTKYDPLALGRLASEPALQLRNVEPYGKLARAAEGR